MSWRRWDPCSSPKTPSRGLRHTVSLSSAEGSRSLGRSFFGCASARYLTRVLTVVRLFFGSLAAFAASRAALAAEILALRHQLAVLERSSPARLPLTCWDRALWALLLRHWSGWKDSLVLVKPDTVIAWHRRAFRLFWRRRSATGRPTTRADIRRLIRQMAQENATWGAPRIHGELLRLGYVVGERTVSHYLARPSRPSPGVDSRLFPDAFRRVIHGLAHSFLGLGWGLARGLLWWSGRSAGAEVDPAPGCAEGPRGSGQAKRGTASAQERHVLVAALAHRLAQLGHAKEVSVTVAGGEDAARALLAFLAEMEARAQKAPSTPEGDAASPDVSEIVPPLSRAIQSVRKRARACLECGTDFEVNPRHAESHRFHSAACRSRYRRRGQAPADLAARTR
jgi:hypothetical protein